MSGKSRYAAVVMAMTASFVLFCAGRFSAHVSSVQPWQVNTARRPPSEVSDVSVSEQSYPESLLPGETININTADIYDLQRLPGIGEKRASNIISWREEHGPFQSVDQLDEVSGIGPGILDSLSEYACVT